jgi:hypothetical protein
MRVYGKGGQLVAESPSREAVADCAPAVGRTEQTLLQDASQLAPIKLELEAVRMYAQCGSLAEVSRALGIAIYELQKLQRTEWWQAELAALRREESAMKNARLTRIHNLTLEALEDRIVHGDFIMRGNGFARLKMSGRDLARAAGEIFKQRQLLIGEPTHIDGTNKTLEKLAHKLRAVGYKDPYVEPVDVEARCVPDPTTSASLERAEREDTREYASGDD